MVPAARPAPAGHRPAARPSFAIEPKALKARGLVTQRPLRRARRGHVAADPDGEGAVRRRQARRAAPTRTRTGYRLVADISASSERKFDAGAGRPGADDRLDRVDAEGRPLGKPAAAPASGSPSSSTPAMAASTAAPKGSNGTVEKVDHAGLCAGAQRTSSRADRPVRRLPDARHGRVPAPRRARAHRPPARGRPVHLDPCRHDQPQGHPRRHGLHRFRQGVRRRGRRRWPTARTSPTSSPASTIKEENHEVADILVDLIRRETHSFSMRFARSLVGELSPTRRADQQSAPLGGLQGAEGARRAVGAGRTRLSLQRQGRGAAARTPDWRGKAADRIADGDRAVCRAPRTGAGG